MRTVRLADLTHNPIAVANVCAGLGWKVFPLRPDTKRPAILDWPSEATTDPDQIEAWWGWSHLNSPVGILTGQASGLWVLDIDVKNANGYNSLRLLAEQHGHSSADLTTFTVRTPSGGAHLYWAWPNGGETIYNSTSKLGPAIDTRGHHGYAHAPHGAYQVAFDNGMTLASAPAWLTGLTQRNGGTSASSWNKHDLEWMHIKRQNGGIMGRYMISKTIRRLANTPPDSGKRNDTLNLSAFILGQLHANGVITQQDAWDQVREACRANGLWDDREGGDGPEQCAKTFMSGWTAGIHSIDNSPILDDTTTDCPPASMKTTLEKTP